MAKDRLNEIHHIYEVLTQFGLKCDFYIVGVSEKDMKYKEKISYNKRISYDDVLKHVANTKCVLNIMEKGNSGITLRDYEAIFFQKLILTNNYDFKGSPLYDANNVLFADDLFKAAEVIKASNPPIRWVANEEYSMEMYFRWLSERLC